MHVNIARSIATEMIRPFGVTVVSNSGVFGVCCIPGSAAVYSSQACKGHRGEPVSAGMGTGVLPFCVCSDLVHFSATMIPCFEGFMSAHDVCLLASNWSTLGGAMFDILRYPKYPNSRATFSGSSDLSVSQIRIIAFRSSISTAV